MLSVIVRIFVVAGDDLTMISECVQVVRVLVSHNIGVLCAPMFSIWNVEYPLKRLEIAPLDASDFASKQSHNIEFLLLVATGTIGIIYPTACRSNWSTPLPTSVITKTQRYARLTEQISFSVRGRI